MVHIGVMIPHGWKYDLPRGLNGAGQWKLMKKVASEIERLGFDSAWFYDHMVRFPEPVEESTFEGWTTAAAVAAITEKVRLGHLCLANSYRYPSFLAKMAATLDCISNGRLELGIGAGYHEIEYAQYGMPFEKNSVRIAKLREAVKLIRLMLTENRPSFTGKYYTIQNAYNFPRPIQKHVPITIAGGGEKLTLKVVAELADRDNMGVNYTLEQHKQRFELLEKYCKQLGRNPNHITHTCLREVVLGKDEGEVRDKFKKYELEAISPWQSVLTGQKRPRVVGTPVQCLEQLLKFKEIGVTMFVLYFPDSAELKSLEIFADKVAPGLR